MVESKGTEPLEVLSQQVEDQCASLIVAKLPPSERHNVVCRLAHRFGWEVTENDLYAAARELGIDLDAVVVPGRPLPLRLVGEVSS